MENLTYSDNEQDDRLVYPKNINLLQNVPQSIPTVPIRSGPHLNDCELEALCTHVVAELPPQYDFIFPPGFEHSEEDESPEDAAIVERTFIRTNITEAGGFKLQFEGFTYCPSMSIYPTFGPSSEVAAAEWMFYGYSTDSSDYFDNFVCFCCFPPLPFRETKSQSITFMFKNEKLLYFNYNPNMLSCGGTQNPVVEMYIPDRSKRIGFMIRGETFKDTMLVMDCVTRSTFFMKRIKVEESESEGQSLGKHVSVMVTDRFGKLIAIAQSTSGWYSTTGGSKWEEFEMKFNPDLPHDTVLKATTKSVLMTAFAMWVVAYCEEYEISNVKSYLWIFLIILLFSILQIVIKLLWF